ncbi:MAG: hypothetical protein L3J53_00395 [Proteobacteria bacterium]|nr:hypothetical protein [Pseudomonadota bacterium]
MSCTNLIAAEPYDVIFPKSEQQLISYQLLENQKNDWISIKNNISISTFPWLTNNNTPTEEIALTWNFTDFLSINLNVFENKYLAPNPSPSRFYTSGYKSFNKLMPARQPTYDVNRSLLGYKFGVSSKLGLGNNYQLGINLDYGQIDGADLIGFTNQVLNTTSVKLGIRKNKFRASLNTDMFLENNIDYKQKSLLGLELDWYFSENTIFSIGSKQRINNPTQQANNLDNITGNVQYIKFQHNL